MRQFLGRCIVAQRNQVEGALRNLRLRCVEMEGTDGGREVLADGGKRGSVETLRGQIHFFDVFTKHSADIGQKRAAGRNLATMGLIRGHGSRERTEIRAQGKFKGPVERKEAEVCGVEPVRNTTSIGSLDLNLCHQREHAGAADLLGRLADRSGIRSLCTLSAQKLRPRRRWSLLLGDQKNRE